MLKPEIPPTEITRQQALCGLNLLDTEPEDRFDRITRSAQRLFGTQIALVSLVDCDRQWFKSRQGLDATETPREISFCGHAILADEVFVVPNALEDPRFSDNPLVAGGPAIRFYAGAPVHSPTGERVGTLCIIDPKPRSFSDEEKAALLDLAACVEAEFARTELLEKARRERHLTMVVERTSYGVAITDAEGCLEWVNRGFEDLTGYSLSEVTGKTPCAFLQGTGSDPATLAVVQKGMKEKTPLDVEIFNYRKDGSPHWVSISFQPVFDENINITNFIIIHSDITGRKQAESQIRSGELRLRAILDNVLDGIISIDKSGTVHTFNAAAEKIFGYAREEVLGRNIKLLMPSPYHDAHDSYLQHFMTTGERKIIGIGREVQGLRKDGTLFPMDLSVSEMELDGQRMFNGIVRDLSPRRELELELKSQVEVLDQFFSIALDLLCIADFDGRFVKLNPSWESVLGYQLGDLEGQPFLDLIHPDDMEPTLKAIGMLAEGEELLSFPNRFRCKDGSYIWLEWRAAASGAHMYATARNITARRAMEEKLKQFESIVQFSDDAIVSKTIDGLVSSWNPAAERMFGYTAGEIIGQPMRLLFPPEKLDEEEAIHSDIASGKKIEPFETVRRRKDGTILDVSVTVSPILDASGKVVGASKIARDISERKRVERLKSEFISTVSHELRTPLTSIRGALNLVMGREAANLPEKSRRMLEMAERNSERLTLLINDILDLEKIEGGTMAFELRTVNLVALAARSLDENEGFATKHHVVLSLESAVSQAIIKGDEHRLLQVLANLISNAVKFSPVGGVVEVRIGTEGEAFLLSVKDQGPGIPAHFRDRIFLRFSQADGSDSREKGGTGLGLSISKAIVERLGGTIGFVSEPGQGCEFFVKLPAVGEGTVSSKGEGPRVLICEDDPDLASIYTELLASEHLLSDRAATLKSARELLAAQSYQLLLLDLTLPDGDGLSFLEELRNHPGTAQLPVLIATGRSFEPSGSSQAGVLSVADWLPKPIDPRRLLDAVRCSIRRHGRPRILHVEDEPDVLQLADALLEGIASVDKAQSLAEARGFLATGPFDLVLLDLSLPDGSGLELLPLIKATCPVVVFSAHPPGPRTSQDVFAVLTKSISSNNDLVSAIHSALARTKGPI